MPGSPSIRKTAGPRRCPLPVTRHNSFGQVSRVADQRISWVVDGIPSRFVGILGSLIFNKETIFPKFLVLCRGGDAKKLSPKENDVLFKKWQKYMEKLAKSGALQDGGPVQSSAATQLVGKARSIKEKRAGNTTSFVGGYSILEVRT